MVLLVVTSSGFLTIQSPGLPTDDHRGGMIGALNPLSKMLGRLFRGDETVRAHPRFLLIKAWGCGFWSDMNHVLGCLLLAEITGRVPVTHWGRNSLFTDRSDADAFRLYFEPVSTFGVDDLRIPGASHFPGKWTADSLRRDNHAKWDGAGSRLHGSYYLRRRETIAVSDFYVHVPDLLRFIPSTHAWHGKRSDEVYRLLAEKYIRPRHEILAEIDEFHRLHMASRGPIIAVHVRGTDKFREPDYDISLETYFDIIDRDAPGWPIFLMTDQAQYLEAFRARYGARVIFTEAHRSGGKTPVHHDRTADHVRLGVEVIKDAYLALRCQKFVGHGLSNPSCMVSVLKAWPEGGSTLLGPSLLQRDFSRRLRRKNRWNALLKRVEDLMAKPQAIGKSTPARGANAGPP